MPVWQLDRSIPSSLRSSDQALKDNSTPIIFFRGRAFHIVSVLLPATCSWNSGFTANCFARLASCLVPLSENFVITPYFLQIGNLDTRLYAFTMSCDLWQGAGSVCTALRDHLCYSTQIKILFILFYYRLHPIACGETPAIRNEERVFKTNHSFKRMEEKNHGKCW